MAKNSGSTAVAVRKNTAVGQVVHWRDKMKEYATKAKAMEMGAGGGERLTVDKQGRLCYNGQPTKNSEFVGIVLAQVIEHAWYSKAYDPNKPAAPDCFALGEDADDMAPHENSVKPQADCCANCEKNEFGSADTGRGKACKQVKRLALISATDLAPDALREAPMVTLTPSVTNTKNWESYERHLRTELDSAPFAWKTLVSSEADNKNQYKMYFQGDGNKPLPDKLADIAAGRVDEATSLLLTPYTPAPEEDKPQRSNRAAGAPARGKPAKAAKKTATKPRVQRQEKAESDEDDGGAKTRETSAPVRRKKY